MGIFTRFKKGLRKLVILLLILGAVAILVITFTTFGGTKIFKRNATQIIIDTDSGNEIDDLYAVARAIISPELDVIGLTSEQWSFHPEAGDSSVQVSQRLNVQLLKDLGRLDIPHPVGAADMLRFWDKPVPQPSPAAEFIIEKAKSLKHGKKLNVVTLGAMTNVASAIIMDPEIAPKIRLYSMALKYDPKSRVWNKNEFNVRNDLDAVDYILNNPEVEIHIMTATTSGKFKFNKTKTSDLMKGKGPVWDFLINRWEQKFPGYQDWVMWDVSLIEAMIDPELVKEVPALSPPENKQRSINVYTYLNKELMLADYESAVMKYTRNHREEEKTEEKTPEP